MERKISSTVSTRMATQAAVRGAAMAGARGTALSITGRVALKTIPVVGWALLAYDVYTVGDALYDWFKDDS